MEKAKLSLVTLVSGGMDSTLIASLCKEEGILQHPIFIDYGQLSSKLEFRAAIKIHKKLELPEPKYFDLRSYGYNIRSGLTDTKLRVNEDAFLPGRNMLFLTIGASYAYQVGAKGITIGLLNEEASIFPDQTKKFVNEANSLINFMIGYELKVVTPLIKMSKLDVIKLLRVRGLQDTYSCHIGNKNPCGKCISCLEINNSIGI